MTFLGTSDTVYWLQLMVDGYPDRARLFAASERWAGDPEKREIADLLVQLIDRMADEVEQAVDEYACEHEDDVEQACEPLNEEISQLQEQIDDLDEGHCPGCVGEFEVDGKKKPCEGGLDDG